MNNTFSLKRFSQLFKKHIAEHAKIYLLSAVVLFGITLLLLEFIVFINNGNFKASYQSGAFTGVLLIAGSIFTSLSFSTLGNKRQAISTLTLPASHFEKYLLQWICSFLLFQLAYVGIFYAADAVIVALNPRGQWQNIPYKNSLLNIFDISNDACWAFIVYFFFHGLSFWGALFFEKLHFIKTAFLFFVTLIFLSITGQAFLTYIIGRPLAYNALPFGSINFTDKGNNVIHIDQPASLITGGIIVLIAVVLLLWGSAYFRLKEKQI